MRKKRSNGDSASVDIGTGLIDTDTRDRGGASSPGLGSKWHQKGQSRGGEKELP